MEDIVKLLKRGIVDFSYKKKDGSIRKATGTLKDFKIKVKKSGNIVYYDTDKKGFRSFKLENLKEVNRKKIGS